MNIIMRGKLVEDINLTEALNKLEGYLVEDLQKEGLSAKRIINALDMLGKTLYENASLLIPELAQFGLCEEEAAATVKEARTILNKDALYLKIKRELGGVPGEITRTSAKEDIFESWQPLGVLGHVTSSNDAMLPFFSAVEGLLAGNINVIKPASGTEAIVMKLVLLICEIEPELSRYFYIFPLSSKQKNELAAMFSCCDGIAVWGGENAVESVRSMAPAGIPVIAWGHRISFAYFTKGAVTQQALEGLAADICANEQQACSAPQVVFFETDDKQDLLSFAQKVYDALEKVSPKYPKHEAPDANCAEITTVVELGKMAEIMGDKAILEASDKSFRVIVEYEGGLTSSPLFRTIIVKPLLQKNILSSIRPFRRYLQSVGLSCTTGETNALTRLLYKAGATRIIDLGIMMSGYEGEPHDGVYALSRYVRRVSLQSASLPDRMMSFAEIGGNQEPPYPANAPILLKADFPQVRPHKGEGYLLLKSGGSSGKSIYAPHSYSDAQTTYATGGNAFYIAGLNPKTDICINLFYSGQLYGGFISVYEALKHIDVIQLPMAATMDFELVADEIIANRVNVVLGMPTYLLRLFNEQEEKLASYGGITKVFYGGEHFDNAQITRLKEKFGVKIIKSLVYGCNEIGAIGYSCLHCHGSEHHLITETRYLEILKLDSDQPVGKGEIGRLVISSSDRNLEIYRYEIGDLGRYIDEPCPCGRTAPKFELLGRFGDTFKFATNYLNYKKIKGILNEHLSYSEDLQVILEYDGISKMTLCVEKSIDKDKIIPVLRAQYLEIEECISEKTGMLTVKYCDKSEFVTSELGGKIRSVVDLRNLE